MIHKSLFLDDYSLSMILRIPKSLPICSAVYIINYSCNECENHFSQSQSWARFGVILDRPIITSMKHHFSIYILWRSKWKVLPPAQNHSQMRRKSFHQLHVMVKINSNIIKMYMIAICQALLSKNVINFNSFDYLTGSSILKLLNITLS